MKMTKTRKMIIELDVDDIKALIAEKYGGDETENTNISFKLKDVSDFHDRSSHYVLNGATVTVSKELE